MNNQIINRIIEIRKHLKLNQTEFGKSIGVSRDVIGNIELGRVEPKPLLLQQIVKEYNVDPYWLETGEGDMFLEKDDMATLMEFAVDMFKDENLEWIRRLCEYINALTPEERADVARYVTEIARAITGDTKKEQD